MSATARLIGYGGLNSGSVIRPKPIRNVSRSSIVTGRRSGNRFVERAVDPGQDALAGHLRQQPGHRLLEVDHVVLDQDHGGRRDDRFGERGDAEDGLAPHGHVAAERRHPDRVDLHIVVPGD
jgi:hypothetical protein